MKKILSILIAVSMLFLFAACGNAVNQVADSVKVEAARLLQGEVTGEIGKAYATKWFEFTVHSINQVDSYAGYSPDEGYTLVDVVVSEKGTFDEPSIMGTFDFYAYSDSGDFYDWPIAPLDDTMMPEEFYLAKDETVNYHIIFEIPEGLSELKLAYEEIDENEDSYATFIIPIVL